MQKKKKQQYINPTKVHACAGRKVTRFWTCHLKTCLLDILIILI